MHVQMESALKALRDVMEKETAETGVTNRTAMVSHWWNYQFRVVYLNWSLELILWFIMSERSEQSSYQLSYMGCDDIQTAWPCPK